MGTGSFSPSPTGQGGALGSGFLKAFGGGSSRPPSQNEVDKEVEVLFKKMKNVPIFLARFNSPVLKYAFEAIFNLGQHLTLQTNWQDLEKQYGITAGPGFLKELISNVIARAPQDTEINKDMARTVMFNFLVKSLYDKFTVYMNCDRETFIAKHDKEIFKKTSNHFLAALLNETLKGQIGGMKTVTEEKISNSAKAQADKVLAHFSNKFRNRQYPGAGIAQVTWRNFFDVAGREKEWLKKNLIINT